MSPSPREGRAGGGSGSTAIELSELRQDRSADFSPLPAVLAGPERGGLKSALLNSMAVLPWGEGRGGGKRDAANSVRAVPFRLRQSEFIFLRSVAAPQARRRVTPAGFVPTPVHKQ